MSEILGKIFGFGDQIKRNLRDAYKDSQGYLENVAHQNNIEWKKNPDERSMGFFNPVPLGTMGNFALRKELGDAVTNLSRREFMKKSAGLAGGSAAASIPGAKLLQKFAPEEKEIAAKGIPKEWTSVEGGAHRYHSLKEYLDDVQMWAKEDFKAADLSGQGARYSKEEFAKRQLLKDEQWYTKSKQELSKTPKDSPMYDVVESHTNAFSPQAKKEMAAWKEMRGKGWENIDEYSRGEIGRGLFPNHNGSLVKNPANDTYHHYLPGQEGRLSDGFNSLDEASNGLTRTLQEAWRNKTRTGF